MFTVATDVEGIFRLNGSAKRIKELQIIFDSPERYGKGLDWTGYTVHDAANILRRYFTHLPQPIVPLDFYERFREPLRSHQVQAVGDREAQMQDIGDFDQSSAITTYQRLITELPALNRQLLLYILDLLAVFASKSDLNLMTSANLAAIFQPGLLSHPTHDMKPQEYRLSQDVLIFLIDNQDSFLIGMSGTAADEKTVKEVQSGAPNRQPGTPTSARASQTGLGRSVSNASAGTDSLRKYGGVRRNLSVSSKNSKKSTTAPSPATPSSGTGFVNSNSGGGVHRSNTLPSKKSPGLASSRFTRVIDSPTSPPPTLTSSNLHPSGGWGMPAGSNSMPVPTEGQVISRSSSITPTAERNIVLAPVGESDINGQSNERLLPNNHLTTQCLAQGPVDHPSVPIPTKERKMSSLFAKSPTSDAERTESRQPNKLKKKRIPSSTAPSAHSSTQSLHNTPDSPSNQAFYTPMVTPGASANVQADPMASVAPILSNTAATPPSEMPPPLSDGTHNMSPLQPQDTIQQRAGSNLKPARSPSPSVNSNSRASFTDASDADHNEDAAIRAEKAAKKRRWRFSSSTKKSDQAVLAPPISSSQIGSNAVAERSTSSIGSWARPQKSVTSDNHQLGSESSTIGFPSASSTLQHSSNETGLSKDREGQKEKEDLQEGSDKKGPLSWLKAKVAQAKEERKEREAEKERAKSPPRNGVADRTGSKHSLSAIAQDILPSRGPSMDGRREEKVQGAAEPPLPNANAS